MRTARAWALCCFILTALYTASGSLTADEPIRGIVVDRSDGTLWLGLPAPARKGAVFDVKLLPGGEAIARAEVTECTSDPPYVATASFKLVVESAFVPVGAYVEASDEAIGDRDVSPGYEPVRLGPKQPNPLSFQAGVFFPIDSALRDETDWGWPFLQLSYRTSSSERSDVRIGLGYYHSDGNFTIGGVDGHRDFRALPLTVDAKVRTSDSRDQGFFWRVGVGAYLIDDERTFAGVTDDTTATTFGWQAGLGYESKSGRFVQLYYVDVSKSDFKGITFSLGARF